jgi:hypothetical protein
MDARTAWIFAGAVWCCTLLSIGVTRLLIWRLRKKVVRLEKAAALHDEWSKSRKASDKGTRVLDLDLHDEG